MARNSEKHFVGLNRVYLEEQWKREREKKRPPLHRLNTAGDVKKWIPSIKREMDYCLQQLSGVRKHEYSEAKVKEFEERVQKLEREHKRFIKKVFELDPNMKDVPWEARSYRKKRKLNENNGKELIPQSKQKVIPVCQALLDGKEELSDENGEDQVTKNNKHEDIMHASGLSRSMEHTVSDSHEQTTKQFNGSIPSTTQNSSLVEYGSSDSDDT